jgi:hypothetical protein
MAKYDLSDLGGTKHDLSDLGGSLVASMDQSQKSPGYFQKWGQDLSRAGENTLQGTLGAGDALRNTLASGLSLLPGVNINPVKSGEGEAYDVGHAGGEIAGFLGGGEGIDALRALTAAKSSGLAGKAAQYLGQDGVGGALKRTLGSAGYGYLGAPEDSKGDAAVTGGVLGLASEAIPGVLKTLVKPRETMKGIQDFFASQQGQYKRLINDVKQSVGDKEIYPKVTNFNETRDVWTGEKSKVPTSTEHAYGEYKDVDKNIFNIDRDINNYHQQFLKDPTFNNAQDLQSQLGKKIREISSKPMDTAAFDRVKALNEAQKAIKNDMQSFVSQADPAAAEKYALSKQIYAKDVAPLKGSDQLNSPLAIQRLLGKTKLENMSPELAAQSGQLSKDIIKQRLAGLTSLMIPSLGLGISGHPYLAGALASGAAGSVIGNRFLGQKVPPGFSEALQKALTGTANLSPYATNPAKAILLGQQP